MYIHNKKKTDFDWDTFFALKPTDKIIDKADKILQNIRQDFKENKYQITFTLHEVIGDLFKNIELDFPLKILELGAATGFLTRFLINQYRGTGVLVDKNKIAYERFLANEKEYRNHITYINEDIFHLDLPNKFNLVCSFGLIEHFKDKEQVINAHKKFVDPLGYILILVPLNTILTRIFYAVHPELNLGYRELLSKVEFENILIDQGLEIIGSNISHGYCYDFIATLCKCV